MNNVDAKRILIACRPGTDDLRSPQAEAALESAHCDPELRDWWDQQQAFQNDVRRRFREIPIPHRLRDEILARAKVVKLPVWRRPVWLSAAAAILLMLVVGVVRQRSSAEFSFETFRSRVVRDVLRQYRMDIKTNDMEQIRQFLAAKNAPADYVLSQNLARFPAMGAGVLSWRDRHVSMVCLDSGPQGPVFLFVVDRSSVKKPPRQRQFAPISELNTVSWSEGEKTYVLAGSGPKTWLEGLP